MITDPDLKNDLRTLIIDNSIQYEPSQGRVNELNESKVKILLLITMHNYFNDIEFEFETIEFLQCLKFKTRIV